MIIKDIAHLLNLSFNYAEKKDHRYCPIGEKATTIKLYRNRIGTCYEFHNNSIMIELANKGEVMQFRNFTNQLERPCVVMPI